MAGAEEKRAPASDMGTAVDMGAAAPPSNGEASPGCQHRFECSDEEQRAVQGLLGLDDVLESPWSPAKAADWPTMQDGYVGARLLWRPQIKAGAMPSDNEEVLLSSKTIESEDEFLLSPTVKFVEFSNSNCWMRESIVRDLTLLGEEEKTIRGEEEKRKRGGVEMKYIGEKTEVVDKDLTSSAHAYVGTHTPVPQEVSFENEGTDTSTATTTPFRSPIYSDNAPSPDCEAIPEEGVGLGVSRSSEMEPDGHEWATRSMRPSGRMPALKEEVRKMPNLPVFYYVCKQDKQTEASRSHVATAAMGVVRKEGIRKDMPQRSLSASVLRTPEPSLVATNSPSPSTLALARLQEARCAAPQHEEGQNDKVIHFGSKKYTIGGRHGVAPWQEKANRGKISFVGAPANSSHDHTHPVPNVGHKEWRAGRAVKGSCVKSGANCYIAGAINASAAVGASAVSRTGVATPSIPTSSQCAALGANVGGMAIGGRALVSRAAPGVNTTGASSAGTCVAVGRGVNGGATAVGAAARRNEIKLRRLNLDISSGSELASRRGGGMPQRDTGFTLGVLKKATNATRQTLRGVAGGKFSPL